MSFFVLLTQAKEQMFKPADRAASIKKMRTPEDARRSDAMLNIMDKVDNGKQERTMKKTFVNSVEFEKKLRWMVQNPPRDSERLRITPMMANEMLKWNDRNRPASEGTVKKYAELMLAGRWHYTGEAIIFSKERLIDGQHRLAACVASGVPFEALVVFGAPDEAFAFIDVGKARTGGDIFAINGVANSRCMAAATSWVLSYEAERHGMIGKGNIAKDHAELFEHYKRHEGLQDSFWVARMFAGLKMAPPAMMCAIHYVCASKNRPQADDFFRKFGEGIGFSGKKDPAYKLHKLLIDAAITGERPGRKTTSALVIKAWNATRRGRDVGALRYLPDEAFPRVI
jgi:hypothetical protein